MAISTVKRIMVIETMDKDFGERRLCGECKKFFYDLNKKDHPCPTCGEFFPQEELEVTRSPEAQLEQDDDDFPIM